MQFLLMLWVNTKNFVRFYYIAIATISSFPLNFQNFHWNVFTCLFSLAFCGGISRTLIFPSGYKKSSASNSIANKGTRKKLRHWIVNTEKIRKGEIDGIFFVSKHFSKETMFWMFFDGFMSCTLLILKLK